MHPYVRAYLAGIALPTMVVPLVLIGLALYNAAPHQFHVEDVLVFPIGLVPNAWGLWNVLYVRLRRGYELPIGLHGVVLAFVLAPLAFGLQLALGKVLWTAELFAIGFPVALVVYFLAWRLVVARFNDLLGVG
jgi:hypothetical protein